MSVAITRPQPLVRSVLGGLLASQPERTVAAADPSRRASRLTVGLARLLGARHLAEAALLARGERAWLLPAVTAVDGIHGLSMVALAVASPTYRRVASTAAALAGGLVLLDIVTLRQRAAADRG